MVQKAHVLKGLVLQAVLTRNVEQVTGRDLKRGPPALLICLLTTTQMMLLHHVLQL